MMTIVDKTLYRRHRDTLQQSTFISELALAMLLFGSVGAVTWAIRGTDGWGGIDGTVVPGLAWGLLWYYLCFRKGLDARGVVLWLGLGLALGGELGYGQYVSWIQGRFNTGEEIIPVAPWVGFVWFIICGIGWGAPGGIVLGWALHGKVSPRAWSVRVALVVVLMAFIFNLGAPLFGSGVVEWLGERFIRYWPGLLFPNAGLGLYAGELDQNLARTVYTNTQNFAVLLWWAAALGVAALQRDRHTLVAGVVIGGGFGIGFAISALWCLGYSFAPQYIDWWKVWELHAGFNLGILYALLAYWAMERSGRYEEGEGTDNALPGTVEIPESWSTLFLAFSGFILVFAAGVEYFFWTGLLLALAYPAALACAMRLGNARETANRPEELRQRVSLAYSVFLLVFLLLHGVSSRAGVLLELYAPESVDQYAWPFARVALFLPLAAALTIAATASLVAMLRPPDVSLMQAKRLPERMTDLLTFIAFVGAVSIWPSEIGVLYAGFLMCAMFAFTRLNRRLDARE